VRAAQSKGEGENNPAHGRRVCRFFAHAQGVVDHCRMRNERRHRRATNVTKALSYQLDDCCKDGSIEAMVVADGDGLPLAAAGDSFACDEVAARMVHVGPRIKEFNGTLLGAGTRWDVQMTKVWIDGSELLVCAVGGTPEQRKKQIARGAAGALRILNAA
jgi:hypothetical protein